VIHILYGINLVVAGIRIDGGIVLHGSYSKNKKKELTKY